MEEQQPNKSYEIKLKFIDFSKSCRKLIQSSLNTDPNSRYNVNTIKDENEIQPKKWTVTSTNESAFYVEIYWIENGLFSFVGDKYYVDYLVGLIKFNFRSSLEYINEQKTEQKIENVKEESELVFDKLFKERSKKVILAVEEGSSAWGLSSVESDHDIRFIYISDMDYYLSVERHKQRDCVMFEEKNMDFSGWDLRKALQLCRDSNPGLLDWLRTSKVLHKEEKIISELLNLAIENYCPKALCFHWMNTAEKHDRLFFGEKTEVILKKYFYVLRPLLCIEWLRLKLMQNQTKELPPMFLIDVLNSLPTDDEACFVGESVKKEIAILIDKKTKSNLGVGPRIPILDEWISKSWQFYGDYCKKLEKRKHDKNDLSKFDTFFQKIIKEYVLPNYKNETII